MIRTIISIPRELKVWLDDYSKKRNRPTAETIREAIQLYKQQTENKNEDLIKETSGIWKNKDIDGAEYMESLRTEWD